MVFWPTGPAPDAFWWIWRWKCITTEAPAAWSKPEESPSEHLDQHQMLPDEFEDDGGSPPTGEWSEHLHQHQILLDGIEDEGWSQPTGEWCHDRMANWTSSRCILVNLKMMVDLDWCSSRLKFTRSISFWPAGPAVDASWWICRFWWISWCSKYLKKDRMTNWTSTSGIPDRFEDDGGSWPTGKWRRWITTNWPEMLLPSAVRFVGDDLKVYQIVRDFFSPNFGHYWLTAAPLLS